MVLKSAFNEFEWIIRILKSAKSKAHMDVVSKCFFLWEKKYEKTKFTTLELKKINTLKSTYWAMFKNKNSKFVKPNIIQ